MKKILYLNSFTVNTTDFDSSDVIGYGITSSAAIKQALQKNYEVINIPTIANQAASHSAYLEWTLTSYKEVLNYLKNDPPDLIFIFHSFHQFPQEIKKMLYHLKLNIPIIGYTHGSHWDPTDTFRHIHCPDLQLTDLANLYCLDGVLFVTNTFKNVVIQNIATFSPDIAETIAKKSFVVGLPINTALIDSFIIKKQRKELSVVFNHAPIPSKNLNVFLRVIENIIPLYPHVIYHITRQITPDSAEFTTAKRLTEQYPKNLILNKTLPISEYYQLLWESDLQISTASHESLGVATLEAMYTKNCCILPNIGAYPEISDGIKDHLYDNETSLTEKLKFYIEHNDERIKLANRLATAAQKYSMPNLQQNFLGVFNQFCS